MHCILCIPSPPDVYWDTMYAVFVIPVAIYASASRICRLRSRVEYEFLSYEHLWSCALIYAHSKARIISSNIL